MLACGSATTPREGYLVGSGGVRIFYRVVGNGPDTIVSIHGGPGGDMNNIAPDLGRLGTRHVVIYYDQRGGGRSELPADTTLLDARYFVEDLEAVPCTAPPEAVEYAHRYTSQITFASFGEWDYTGALRGVQAPLLVIYGDRDPSPVSSQRAWAAAVPRGRLLVIPGARHGPHVDRPDVFFSAVDTFLSGGWPEGGLRCIGTTRLRARYRLILGARNLVPANLRR